MALGYFNTASITCATAALGLLLPPVSRAQAAFEATARVGASRVARAGEDATSATTSVDLMRRNTPLETVAEVLQEVPGSRPAESGGYGFFTSVSLRGNEPSHTTFWIGAAPLDDPESGTFDLSLVPLSHFARLEVYRGGAPLLLSQGAIAGAVRLVPRDDAGEGVEARLGAGSFGLWQGFAAAHVRPDSLPGFSWFTSAQAAHSDSDYPYFDDRQTRFDPSDDLELRLRNAGVTEASGLSHLRAPLAGGEIEAVAFGIRRLGGAPGAVGLGSTALQTRRGLSMATASTVYTLRGRDAGERRYALQLLLGGRCTGAELYDPFGELGGGAPSSTVDTRLHGYARLAGSYQLLPFLDSNALVSYGHAGGERRDELRAAALSSFERGSVAGALELRLFGAPLGRPSELRASARLESTRVDADVIAQLRPRHDQVERFVQAYRAALATEPLEGLKLRGSFGTGTRPPSAAELFGDGVSVRPNGLLRPERGLYADAGFVLDGAVGALHASAELTGFLQDVDDKIIFTSTNQFETIAENLGHARIRGLEAGLELALTSGSRLIATTTLLHTRGPFDRQLPLRPRLRAHGRIEQSLRLRRPWAERLTVFLELSHEGTAYYDLANEVLRPPLTKFGCGLLLALLEGRVELAARMADVFDARGQDYLRFPLPGRSLFFLATLRGGQP